MSIVFVYKILGFVSKKGTFFQNEAKSQVLGRDRESSIWLLKRRLTLSLSTRTNDQSRLNPGYLAAGSW